MKMTKNYAAGLLEHHQQFLFFFSFSMIQKPKKRIANTALLNPFSEVSRHLFCEKKLCDGRSFLPTHNAILGTRWLNEGCGF